MLVLEDVITEQPFSTDGLVLHAPLWSEQLVGTTFRSIDKYGRLCTVTGAIWTPQGRKFDGVDDKIVFSDAGFPTGNSARTLLMWVNPASVTKDYQEFFHYGTDGTGTAILLATSTIAGGGRNVLKVGKYGGDSGASTGTLTAGVFQLIGFTLSGTAIEFFMNGATAGTTTLAGVNTTLGGATAGAIGLGWNSSYITGSCGEVVLYNRVLSAPEIQNHYLATKGRFI